jgi:hypothetical protein
MAIELTTATTEQLQGIRESLGEPSNTNIFPNAKFRYLASAAINSASNPDQILYDGASQYGNTVDFLPFSKYISLDFKNLSSLTNILNGSSLISLEDGGTFPALEINNCGFSESTLNQFFTDLPATTKTATINVVGNPGAATCDPTIATNKGYTVVTS